LNGLWFDRQSRSGQIRQPSECQPAGAQRLLVKANILCDLAVSDSEHSRSRETHLPTGSPRGGRRSIVASLSCSRYMTDPFAGSSPSQHLQLGLSSNVGVPISRSARRGGQLRLRSPLAAAALTSRSARERAPGPRAARFPADRRRKAVLARTRSAAGSPARPLLRRFRQPGSARSRYRRLTPPPVTMSPSRTTRSSAGVAPNSGRESCRAQWQAARLPRNNSAAPSASDSVHTEATYCAVAASRSSSPGKVSSANRGVGDAAAAGHADYVAGGNIGQASQPGEGQPTAALDHPTRDAGHDHLSIGQGLEHLMRPSEVELRHAGENSEDDNQLALAHRGGFQTLAGRS
jgi:hypothetical protein